MEGGPRALLYSDSRSHFWKSRGSALHFSFTGSFHALEPDPVSLRPLLPQPEGAQLSHPAGNISSQYIIFTFLFPLPTPCPVIRLSVSSQYLATRNPWNNQPIPFSSVPNTWPKTLPLFRAPEALPGKYKVWMAPCPGRL